MTFDEEFADRVRRVLADTPAVTERKMFGGLAFMVAGNMCCGLLGDDLIVRVGKEAYEDALDEPHVREMDVTGRPMTGIVIVGSPVTNDPDELRAWVARGLRFVRTLPAKG